MRRLVSTWPVAAAFLALLSTVPAARAVAQPDTAPQDTAAAWQEYEAAEVEYAAAIEDCESREVSTTSGDRACRAAAVSAGRVSRALQRLLAVDSTLVGEQREVAVDAWLTYRQHAARLLYELGECGPATERLEALAAAPELATRPLLREAVHTSLDDARRCSGAAATPPRAEASAAPREQGVRWAPWVLTGASAVVAATGVGIAAGPFARANDTVRCWNSSGCDPGLSQQELDAVVDRRTRHDRAASALIGVGAVGIGSGIGWALLADRSRGPEVSLAPTLAELGARVSVRF